MNVLGLEEFTILQIWDSEQYYKFVVEAKEEPFLCTQCGSMYNLSGTFTNGKKFKLHDKRSRTVKDVDLRGKKVIIEIQQKRYRCPECGEVFTEFFQEIDRDDKVTLRLRKHMGEESIKARNTFKSVSEQYGVSDMTVKRAFDMYVESLDRNRVMIAPRILGIDEVYINLPEKREKTDIKRKLPCAVFTDIETHEIIEFKFGITKEAVMDTIRQMQGYKDIEVVTMDMNSGYRNAVKDLIPKAYCIVDHFHVIQKVNMKLNEIRAGIQSKLPEGGKGALFAIKKLITSNRENLDDEALLTLDTELAKHPHLQQAYLLKEGLRDVYKAESKYDAFQRYFAWEQTIPNEAIEIKGIQRMINRLKKEVFQYFDGRFTNAYTESFNNVIKRIVRLGVGYSYEILRAKVLYGTKATEVKKVKQMNFIRIQKNWGMSKKESFEPITVYSSIELEDGVPLYPSYRTSIGKLLTAFEEGEI